MSTWPTSVDNPVRSQLINMSVRGVSHLYLALNSNTLYVCYISFSFHDLKSNHVVPNLELFQLHTVDCRETSHFIPFFPGAFGVEAKEEDDRMMY